jgi:hypothetical protein
MKTIKKLELLNAMRGILYDYENNKHRSTLDSCKLCRLYNRNCPQVHKDHECSLCPMYVFFETRNTIYPCMKRKCEPVDCDGYVTNDSNELLAVIDFYKEVISTVRNMTSEELNKKNAFKFLIKIDKKVAKKYSLV